MNCGICRDWFRTTQTVIKKKELNSLANTHEAYISWEKNQTLSIPYQYTHKHTTVWSVDTSTKAYPTKKYLVLYKN
jgi:hypothetical protein